MTLKNLKIKRLKIILKRLVLSVTLIGFAACSPIRIAAPREATVAPKPPARVTIPRRPDLASISFISPDEPSAHTCLDSENFKLIYRRERTLINHINVLELLIREMQN
jgi:hypothetical protein